MLCSVVCVYNDHRSDCECFTYQLIVLCLPIQLSLPCGTVAESCTLLLYQLSRCYALPVEGAGDTPQEGGTSLPGPLCFASFLLLRCVGFPGSLLHPCEWLSEFFRHLIWLPVGSRALCEDGFPEASWRVPPVPQEIQLLSLLGRFLESFIVTPGDSFLLDHLYLCHLSKLHHLVGQSPTLSNKLCVGGGLWSLFSLGVLCLCSRVVPAPWGAGEGGVGTGQH